MEFAAPARPRRVRTGTMLLVLGMIFSMLGFLTPPAFAVEAEVSGPTTAEPALDGGVCDDGNGFANRDDSGPSFSISGDWGSLSADAGDGFATANVKAGWSVELCVKATDTNHVYTVTCPPGESPADDCDPETLESPAPDSVSHIAARNPQFTPPAPQPSATLACEEVETDQFSISYTLDKDGSTNQFDLTGPSGVADLAEQTTPTVVVPDAAGGVYAISGTAATLKVDGDCTPLPEEPEVDFCDPTGRPDGMSIDEWLTNAETLSEGAFDRSDCFEVDIANSCGSFTATLTANDTPYDYRFRWVEGTTKAANPDTDGEGGDNAMPASFNEDHSGGEVQLTYYIVGPEADYFQGTDIANWWSNPQTVTVDTDCQDPEPEVEFCDPTGRPDGMSIDEWLTDAETLSEGAFDRSDCFEVDIANSCGSFTATLTTNDTPYDYRLRWVEGTTKAANPDTDGEGGDNAMPASFDEDHSGGEVQLTYYIVGPEADYFQGTDIANWWSNPQTVTVDTDCQDPEPPAAPSFTVESVCDETTDEPNVVVTVTSNPDGEPITIEVTGEGSTTITETTVFEGDAFDVLTASHGETEERATFRDDCAPAELLPSTASFTTGSECRAGLPALTYDATVSETADDPIGDITLTVADTDGVERAEASLSENAAGSLLLPSDLEGETVTASWDFDGTTTEQTLATNCADVLGVVEEPDRAPVPQDEDPVTLPEAEVKGEQLANTGADAGTTALFSFLLMAFGATLLLSDRRHRRHGVTG